MKRVLIADDNGTNLYLLESLLRAAGFDAVTARDGREALEKARAAPPDLAITDILMPAMDGYALCRAWKADPVLGRVPLAFYTATYTEPKDEDLARDLGADLFLVKPQEPEVILAAVRRLTAPGYEAARPATRPFGDEMEFFRRHNAVLFRKLEKKMLDLEAANRGLALSEERFRLSFENATDLIILVDADRRVARLSPSIERILGRPAAGYLGKALSALGEAMEGESFARMLAAAEAAMAGAAVAAATYHFVAADGGRRCLEASVSPLRGPAAVEGVLLVARDVTERARAAAALEASLAEKEALLREVHHRVKNNMQVIISLLRLTEKDYEDTAYYGDLEELIRRVQAMAAVHDQFYVSGDLARIDFAAHLARLIEHARNHAGPGGAAFEAELDLERAMLPLGKAVPAGLAANELISEALRRGAAAGGGFFALRVRLRTRPEGRVELRVELGADRAAIPAGAGAAPGGEGRPATMSGMLMATLAEQLGGSLEFDPGGGLGATLSFPA